MAGRAPVVTSTAAQHFWDQCREHTYVLQQCTDCQTVRYPPGRVCPACMSRAVEWVESPGRGTVFSYTTVSRAPSPEFEAWAPYTVGLIDLDEGVRVMGNIVNCQSAEIHVGMPVQVFFQDVGDGVVLPQFEPSRKE
jgi:uncharacterized OB-fold protein